MKKFSILFAAILMLCLTLAACKDTPLEGYWVVSEAEIYGKKINIDEATRDRQYPFLSLESDSKYVIFFVGKATKGKWEKSEKGIKLYIKNDKTVEVEKVGDKLVMNVPELQAKYVFSKSNEKPKAYDEVTEK